MNNSEYIKILTGAAEKYGELNTAFEYKTPYGTEYLYSVGSNYFIVSATLRGFTALWGKASGNSENIYIPKSFECVIHDAVKISEDEHFAAMKPEKRSIRYDFNIIDGKKNSVYAEIKKADTLSYRRQNKLFVLEEERLIKRAVDDNLNIQYIIYTLKSTLLQNGTIENAKARNIPCFIINDGLMASVTATHPTPHEIALCGMPEYRLLDMPKTGRSTVLIADNIENPDNLGLIIRTADACGADAVIAIGKQASIYHKNCVRAARGAMGRMPVFEFDVSEFGEMIELLRSSGYKIFGSSAKTKLTAHNTSNIPLRAFVVSNETFGISDYMEKAADEMIRIPMATGQSSFNVAVAAGIILAEALRFE